MLIYGLININIITVNVNILYATMNGEELKIEKLVTLTNMRQKKKKLRNEWWCYPKESTLFWCSFLPYKKRFPFKAKSIVLLDSFFRFVFVGKIKQIQHIVHYMNSSSSTFDTSPPKIAPCHVIMHIKYLIITLKNTF